MFKLGGNNIIMNNAKEEIKKYATFICPNAEDNGVACGINKIIRGEL